ncbi:hypothetical protein SMU85_05831 [Streptococcus mutans ST6]|nr:hypothetical protein SMU85_05831 [Streptococcus mutans ST6]
MTNKNMIQIPKFVLFFISERKETPIKIDIIKIAEKIKHNRGYNQSFG